MTFLPGHTSLAILASQKLGHVMQCQGVARALGLEPQMRNVAPRAFFRVLAPWGPPDPGDKSDAPDAALRRPYPDIAIASGRETVPYRRALKRLSGGRTFSVYIGDPRTSHGVFDLICAPEHDRLRGGNVISTLTSPHPRDAAARDAARNDPDPSVAKLASPRIAMLLGGPSGQYKFSSGDIDAIANIAAQILASGAGLMISPSRRTPPALLTAIRNAAGAGAAQTASRLFIWDGTGANPYLSMLAMADAFVVTTDSVNMISEAIATGRPVHICQPSGHAGKFAHFIDTLLARGIVRPWAGRIEHWSYEKVDATPFIAQEIATRYRAFAAQLK